MSEEGYINMGMPKGLKTKEGAERYRRAEKKMMELDVQCFMALREILDNYPDGEWMEENIEAARELVKRRTMWADELARSVIGRESLIKEE